MTLTTFSKDKFSALYRWTIKRNKSCLIIYSIILAVCGPVLQLYFSAVSDEFSLSGELGLVSLAIYTGTAVFFTFVSALNTFSFLHSKRRVDMFGALPCNRTTMFLAHLCGGLTVIGVPYLIGAFLMFGIGLGTEDFIGYALAMIISTVLMIIASYIFMALIAYCCGTVIDTAISAIAINSVWMAAVLLLFGFMDDLIPGVDFESILNTPLLTAFAPFGFGYMGIYAYYEDILFFVTFIIWCLIFIAAEFFAALVLANKRKAETSQNGFAVKWLPVFIKAAVSVISGALVGYIAASTSYMGFSNMISYVFWYIIGSFIAFFVLHIIFSRGLKGGFVKSAIVYGCTSVAAVALIFAMCFGLGVDTKVPNASSVKSVTFEYMYLGVNCFGITFEEPENIELVTQMHQIIADGIRNDYNYPYYFGYDNRATYDSYDYVYDDYVYDYYEDDDGTVYYLNDDGKYVAQTETADEYTDTISSINTDENLTYGELCIKYPYVAFFDFEFDYDMKLGFDVSRNYYISVSDGSYYDLETLNELAKQLVSSEECKRQVYDYIFNDDTRLNTNLSELKLNHYEYDGYYSDYYYYSMTGYSTLYTDDEFVEGLCEALREDILADDEFVPYDTNDFYLGESYMELVFTKKGSLSDTYTYTETCCDVIVKESYTNTIKYLDNYRFDFSEYYYGYEIDDYYNDYYYYYGDEISNESGYYYTYDYYLKNDAIYNALVEYWSFGQRADWINAVELSLDEMMEAAYEKTPQGEEYYDLWYEQYYDETSEIILYLAKSIYNELLESVGVSGNDIYYPDTYEVYYMMDTLTNYAAASIEVNEIDISTYSDTDTGSDSDTSTDSEKSSDSDTSTDSEKSSDSDTSTDTDKSSDSNKTSAMAA